MAYESSPSTNLYTLGRGILRVGLWVSTTPPVSLSDVGNCSEFNITVTEEKLEHPSYRAGLRTKDKIVVLETGYEGSFTLDEISMDNLVRFFKGTLSGNVIKANTVTDAEYEIEFTQNNPVGENRRWTFHRVFLSPGGEFGLIADEWATLQFTMEGLSDVENNPDSEFFNIEYLTTTTA